MFFHTYKILRVDKIGQKVEWWFSWVKEKVKWGVNVWWAQSYTFAVIRSMEEDSGDEYTTMWMYLIHWTVHLKIFNSEDGISLLVQWIRIHLQMQGTWVLSPVQEDSMCCRATKPMRHSYWGCMPQLLKLACFRALTWQLLKPVCLEPVLHNKRSHFNVKPEACALQQMFTTSRESQCAATKTQYSQK